jgi:hypothetical protein
MIGHGGCGIGVGLCALTRSTRAEGARPHEFFLGLEPIIASCALICSADKLLTRDEARRIRRRLFRYTPPMVGIV